MFAHEVKSLQGRRPEPDMGGEYRTWARSGKKKSEPNLKIPGFRDWEPAREPARPTQKATGHQRAPARDMPHTHFRRATRKRKWSRFSLIHSCASHLRSSSLVGTRSGGSLSCVGKGS